MKIAYFDCIAGASGDMILGALVDAGLALSDLQARLDALHLPDFHLEARKVAKNAFSATKVDVIVSDTVPERHLGDILSIVEESDLPAAIKEKAVAIFRKIGTAEAAIHDTSLESVHLHELGGVDTIVDVVGALVGLEALGIEHVVVSPIPLGRGFIRGAHGRIPLPAPATVALLKGAPVVGSPLEVETVTPTGAALLASLGDAFGAIPGMKLEAVGYGAGSRDFAIPNVLRILIGEGTAFVHHAATAAGTPHHHGHSHAHSHTHPHTEKGHGDPHPQEDPTHREHDHTHEQPEAKLEARDHTTAGQLPHEAGEQEQSHAYGHDIESSAEHTHDHSHSCLDTATLKVLETNIDDLNPETYEYVMDRLFAAGALDVFLAPIQMKKNRPGTLLRVLCRPETIEALVRILFLETSTLGVREQTVNRHALTRSIEHVDTAYGSVHVKLADLGEGSVKSSPEYEDCRRLAHESGVPLREVYQAAQEASRRRFGG